MRAGATYNLDRALASSRACLQPPAEMAPRSTYATRLRISTNGMRAWQEEMFGSALASLRSIRLHGFAVGLSRVRHCMARALSLCMHAGMSAQRLL